MIYMYTKNLLLDSASCFRARQRKREREIYDGDENYEISLIEESLIGKELT